MKSLGPCISIVSFRHAAIRCQIIPLKQDEITAKSIGKFEQMMERVISISSSRQSSKVCPGNVGSPRIERMHRRTIQFILDKCQRIGIETFLCSNLAWRDGTSLDFEMTLVMGCQDTFDVNNCAFFVAGLNDGR